jgi:hypothetical protein
MDQEIGTISPILVTALAWDEAQKAAARLHDRGIGGIFDFEESHEVKRV